VWEEMGVSRVDGHLSVSRAFGSYQFKAENRPHADRKVSCVPEVFCWDAAAGDVFVVACDGLWDVLSSQDVAREVSTVDSSTDLAGLARVLVEKALALGSADNISCAVTAFGPSHCQKPAKELTLGGYVRASTEDKRRHREFWRYCGFEKPTEPIPETPVCVMQKAKPTVLGENDAFLLNSLRSARCRSSMPSSIRSALEMVKADDRLGSLRPPMLETDILGYDLPYSPANQSGSSDFSSRMRSFGGSANSARFADSLNSAPVSGVKVGPLLGSPLQRPSLAATQLDRVAASLVAEEYGPAMMKYVRDASERNPRAISFSRSFSSVSS
jgi:hypothetical protein